MLRLARPVMRSLEIRSAMYARPQRMVSMDSSEANMYRGMDLTFGQCSGRCRGEELDVGSCFGYFSRLCDFTSPPPYRPSYILSLRAKAAPGNKILMLHSFERSSAIEHDCTLPGDYPYKKPSRMEPSRSIEPFANETTRDNSEHLAAPGL
ncbi:uncharacterized protein MYCFIDRAFT_170134 [Pseudocercospora fijiensis CIRAD86]|uniref:Uncharacterized protein n=1 Tax=Pseudocercospora fijiensis (strain CIRAD86) TaxID=383855 RepID=N1Q7B5_PSEFD|nr:uncharacterized protein MYCFIDRAFT_170134 [Pseudocercospora fijiensis CIRAD86]EME88530.1 hypothetical protein MYCFIDRAFT_170134 [Pseudocercospora fijiensis CIRAD86]